jgi:hypothetical protein
MILTWVLGNIGRNYMIVPRKIKKIRINIYLRNVTPVSCVTILNINTTKGIKGESYCWI